MGGERIQITLKADNHSYVFVLICVLNKSLTVCLSDRLIVCLVECLSIKLCSLYLQFSLLIYSKNVWGKNEHIVIIAGFQPNVYDNQVKLLMAPAFFICTSNKQVTAKESSDFSFNTILFLIHSYNLNNL